jgi:hypothetical protein
VTPSGAPPFPCNLWSPAALPSRASQACGGRRETAGAV